MDYQWISLYVLNILIPMQYSSLIGDKRKLINLLRFTSKEIPSSVQEAKGELIYLMQISWVPISQKLICPRRDYATLNSDALIYRMPTLQMQTWLALIFLKQISPMQISPMQISPMQISRRYYS